MTQSSTQPNTAPATEPNKAQPAQAAPQTDAEKKAMADKAAGNSNAKS